MNHVITLCASLALLGMPAILLAIPAATGPATQQPPATSAATKPRQAAPAAKIARPQLGETRRGQSAGLASAALPQSERLAALPPAPSLPQLVMLRGTVVRATGQPCAGASVYPAQAPRQLVVTDAQGAFALPVPVGAAVSLRVDYFGEGNSRVEIPLPTADLLHIILGQ